MTPSSFAPPFPLALHPSTPLLCGLLRLLHIYHIPRSSPQKSPRYRSLSLTRSTPLINYSNYHIPRSFPRSNPAAATATPPELRRTSPGAAKPRRGQCHSPFCPPPNPWTPPTTPGLSEVMMLNERRKEKKRRAP